jgi:hypothetical protein
MRSLGLVLLAACASGDVQPQPPTVAPRDPPAIAELGLNPGESMAFDVRLAGILAGEAQLAVGELGDYEGRRAIVVKSRAATAGALALIKHIVDEATTVVDVDTGRPLALETVVEQGNTRTRATATFTDRVANITYIRSDEKAPHHLAINFGSVTVHDAHTAMAQLRGWRASPGTTRSVFVVGGRRVWRVDVTYAGEDSIGSVLGNRRAIRFTGQSFRVSRALAAETAKPARTFSVWLSDDADRVPLRVTAGTELGDIVFELTEYRRSP